jgi:hypothetical protein
MCRDEEGEMKPKAEEGGAMLSVGESNGDTDMKPRRHRAAALPVEGSQRLMAWVWGYGL